MDHEILVAFFVHGEKIFTIARRLKITQYEAKKIIDAYLKPTIKEEFEIYESKVNLL
jgi:DNA polymerase I-like protein with 3'-5' exonuclease and polymerase domains